MPTQDQLNQLPLPRSVTDAFNGFFDNAVPQFPPMPVVPVDDSRHRIDTALNLIEQDETCELLGLEIKREKPILQLVKEILGGDIEMAKETIAEEASRCLGLTKDQAQLFQDAEDNTARLSNLRARKRRIERMMAKGETKKQCPDALSNRPAGRSTGIERRDEGCQDKRNGTETQYTQGQHCKTLIGSDG